MFRAAVAHCWREYDMSDQLSSSSAREGRPNREQPDALDAAKPVVRTEVVRTACPAEEMPQTTPDRKVFEVQLYARIEYDIWLSVLAPTNITREDLQYLVEEYLTDDISDEDFAMLQNDGREYGGICVRKIEAREQDSKVDFVVAERQGGLMVREVD